MRNLVIYLISILFCFSCSTVEEDAVSVEEKQYPDQESWNTEIILTKDGQIKAVIIAGHFTKNNDESVVVLDEMVDIDFFDEEQSHISHLKALRARVNERTNDLIAEGNVVVVSDSGETLFTEELRWDHKRERIISETFITLVSDYDTLTGIGFESDSDLKNWIIEKPAGVTDRTLK